MLTTADAARALGLRPARVRQLIAAGMLPAKRHGRDWDIDPADLAKVADRPKVGWPKGRARGAQQSAPPPER